MTVVGACVVALSTTVVDAEIVEVVENVVCGRRMRKKSRCADVCRSCGDSRNKWVQCCSRRRLDYDDLQDVFYLYSFRTCFVISWGTERHSAWKMWLIGLDLHITL